MQELTAGVLTGRIIAPGDRTEDLLELLGATYPGWRIDPAEGGWIALRRRATTAEERARGVVDAFYREALTEVSVALSGQHGILAMMGRA